jgi:hypothetical protein
MMPPSATFAYVVRVPDGGTKNAPWVMDSLELHTPTGEPLIDNRLVGWKPMLYISDAGLTPNASTSRPSVLRSELRLVATDKDYASTPTASYFLDKALVNVLRAGDVFHMARTGCGGLGFSALRRDKLIFAVGQISAVPLGSGIKVGTPEDLLKDAEAVFRRRDPESLPQESYRNSPIKAAATPSGWLYKPETLSEISVTTEQFCAVRM